MSNEVTFQFSVVISADAINDQYNHQTQLDMVGRMGPSPGAFKASNAGTNVSFSNLSTPGLAILKNLSQTVSVEYGIYDTVHAQFFPLGLIKPGKQWPIYLSPNLGEDYYNTGTGTSAKLHYLHIKGIGGDADVVVEAYEA